MGSAGDSWGKDYKEIRVSCESMPGKEIYVLVENVGTKNEIVRYNYLANKYENETKQYLQDFFNDEFENSAVFYKVRKHAQSTKVGKNASFKEFLKDDGGYIIIHVAIPQSKFKSKEQIENLIKNLSQNCGKAKIYASVIKDKEIDTLTDSDKFQEKKAFRKYFEHVEAGIEDIIWFEWTSGNDQYKLID